MEEKMHWLLGGSSANRWVNCHGYVSYVKNLPKQAGSIYMDTGTVAHKLCETLLREHLRFAIAGEAQATADSGGQTSYEIELADTYSLADTLGVEITDEMYDDAEEYVRHIWEDVLEGFVTNKHYGLEDSFILNEDLQMGGTADFWAIWTDDRGNVVANVTDYKNGRSEVEITNEQFIFYLCGLRKAMQAQGTDIDYGTVAVFQPHAESGNTWKTHKYTAKQLDKHMGKFEKAAHAILVEGSQKLKTGSWCKFCPAKAVCTKYVADRSKETALAMVEPAKLNFPSPEQVPLETLIKINEHASDIRKYLSAVHEHLKAAVIAGHGPVELKVVETTGRRKWGNNVEAIESHFNQLGLLEVTTKKLKGITDISKGLKKLKLKASEVEELVNSYTVRHPNRLVLVDATDERPAVLSGTQMLLSADEINMEETE